MFFTSMSEITARHVCFTSVDYNACQHITYETEVTSEKSLSLHDWRSDAGLVTYRRYCRPSLATAKLSVFCYLVHCVVNRWI